MSFKIMQTEWPGGFKSGDAVIHGGCVGHVVSIPPRIIPDGHVPVMYDDESGCFIDIPADDLDHRFKKSL